MFLFLVSWLKFPETIRWLEDADQLRLRSFDSLLQELNAVLHLHGDEAGIGDYIRRIREREFLRCAVNNCIFGIDVVETVSYISF